MQLMTITSYSYSIDFDCGDLHEQFDHIYDGEINKDCLANVWHEYDSNGDWLQIVRSDGYKFPPITYDLIDNVDGTTPTSNQQLVSMVKAMLRTR